MTNARMESTRNVIFKICTAVVMVTLITWNGYNTKKLKRLDDERAMVKEDLIKEVERRSIGHSIIKRELPNLGNFSKRGGAVYIRWGRKTCGADSELVYEGHAGGSWFQHTGGASNYICLPKRPLWNKSGGCSAYVYGAEYEQIDQFLSGNNEGNLVNQNVPCAVCYNGKRSSQLMIPARNVCFPGWTLEYQGYLMTGATGHKNNYDYVCVDEAPEGDPAGYRDENGALFYAVCAQCGSLPCPSYIGGKKLTCAVCTK